jgi:transcriptional regulator GlxA family with amidase domain
MMPTVLPCTPWPSSPCTRSSLSTLSTPIEVFTRTRLPDGRAAYRVRICGATPTVDADVFTLQPPWGLDALADADTIILPGCADPTAPIPDHVLDALRQAAANGARIASICSGAFILAATGLLDGKRATTHWLAAALLAELHPAIDVDPDVLYVDNGQFLTSAGAPAGLDLCLHLIRRDHGSAVAADAARLSVMPLEREGGQAQFIVHDQPPAPRGSVLEPVLRWMQDNSSRQPGRIRLTHGLPRPLQTHRRNQPQHLPRRLPPGQHTGLTRGPHLPH